MDWVKGMQEIDTLIEDGTKAFSAGDLPKAKQLLEDALQQNGEKWMGWRALGQVLLATSENQKASEAFKRATVIRPDDAENQYGLGLALQRLEDHGHAIPAFEAALRYDGGHKGAKEAMAVSCMARCDAMRQIGNLLAVEEYLEKAHKCDPGNQGITAQLLTYFDETGQPGKSQAVIKDLKAHGYEVPEHHATGSFKTSTSAADGLGSEPADIPALRAALEQNGEDWQAWRALGRALLKDSKPADAAEAFKKATVIRFDDADSQCGYGLALQAQGDHGHAIPPFEQALHQNPSHEEAKAAMKVSLLARCQAMRDIGNLLAIEQYLEKAYKLDESDTSVKTQLLDYYRETGQAGKSAQLGGGATFVAVSEASVAAQMTNKQHEDVVLEYRAPEPDEDDAYMAPPQPVQQGPAMLPCPACKQMMPALSKQCVHCGALVDAQAGLVHGGGPKKPEEKKGFFGKLFGK